MPFNNPATEAPPLGSEGAFANPAPNDEPVNQDDESSHESFDSQMGILSQAQMNHLLLNISQYMADANHRSRSASTHTKHELEPRMEGPAAFMGERAKLGSFLADCMTVFEAQPSRYGRDSAHIFYIGARLDKATKEWWKLLIRKPQHERPDWFYDYEAFIKEFKRVWGDPDSQGRAERAIHGLRMKGSLTAYASEFQRLVLELQWDLECAPVCSMFYYRLATYLKDEMSHSADPCPKTTTPLIERALLVDSRIQARNAERQAESGDNTPTATSTEKSSRRSKKKKEAKDDTLDTPQSGKANADPNYKGRNNQNGKWRGFTLVNGKVPCEELDLRDKYKECRKCGEPGHKADDCTTGKGKSTQ